MRPKKLLVIIPDGVSLRNFVFTQFPHELEKAGWNFVYLNMTPFKIEELGFKEIRINPRPSSWTDLLKRAKIIIELDLFKKKFKDPVFDKYKFPPATKGLKNKIKNFIVSALTKKYHSEKGLEKIREKMKISERTTDFYKSCKELLVREDPDMVFCTNQRPVNAIAPITAAQDLGIPTSCFIFSWDNLPKATKVLDTDIYLVWSEYMKKELLKYYPYIRRDQVEITGTPQFEIHYDKSAIISRDNFFEKYGLDIDKEYLCFSGDDVTTSPHDEIFLNDVAEGIEDLNKQGANLGIIFRRCPVDFSGRYNNVLRKFEHLVVPIEPIWTNAGNYWNLTIPEKEDLALQTNIIEHSFMVINVGSSMVFDYAAKGKPCAYINYIPRVKELKKDIREVYSYTHFKSMPNDKSVYWINRRTDISSVIENALENPREVVDNVKDWLSKINKVCIKGISREIIHKLESIL